MDSIAHLDRGKINVTPGGYDEFVRIRTERAAQQAAAAQKIATQKAHMQAYRRPLPLQGEQGAPGAVAPEGHRQAAGAGSGGGGPRHPLCLPRACSTGAAGADAGKVSVGYGGPPILRGLNLRVDMDDRIALLGANGNGKSTLAKLVAGKLAPDSGHMHRSGKLRVGYFAQHQTDELVAGQTPIDHMARALPNATPQVVRSQLARFGLDADRADTPVQNCSGGEKARLLLALATRDAPQLLILDEPTNHLDIDAREALVRALADYQGAVLLITHDPHLVDLVADTLWLVADGKVEPYEGDLDDYRALLTDRARPAPKADATNRRDERKERAEARAAVAPLRKKAKDAEERIARLTRERRKLEAKLADPDLYSPARKGEVAAAQSTLAALKRQLASAETEWLAAEEALEAASA